MREPHRIERTFDGGDVTRPTLPLPTGPGHVHAYLLEDETLVDTLRLPDARERWAGRLRGRQAARGGGPRPRAPQ